MEDATSTLTLPDGRTLGYAQFGPKTGYPIILCHGLACSRLDGLYYHDIAIELNARVIGVDRPGHGLSTSQPNRTLLGFAEDVRQLTEHLGLERYSAMGISGGGPSVLACAKALPPSRLKSIAVVVGLGPPDIGMSGARLINRIGFPYGFRFCPSFANRWFWTHVDPIGRVDLSDEERLRMMLDSAEKSKSSMSEKEYAILSDPEYHMCGLKSTREGFRQGFDGTLVDGRLCCLPFGFEVEEIRKDLPVHLWYGKQDVFVPPNHGVQLKKRLGDGARLHLEDETHCSLTWNKRKEILASLMAVD